MSTAVNTNQNGMSLEAALKYQEMGLEQLKLEAEKLGVKLQNEDKAEIIDTLISAAVQHPVDAKPGILLSLHSRTDEAKALILRARSTIVKNEKAAQDNGRNSWRSLFLQNQEGTFYSKRVPACSVRLSSLPEILNIVAPLPDGSQTAVLEELRASPENFEEPLLVRISRRGKEEGQFNQYVMLYVKRKQQLVEEAF